MEVEIKGEKYELRQMTKETIKDFYKLFSENRDKDYDLNHFINKFSYPPGDDFYYGFLLYKNGIAVAHSGAIPFYAFLNGERYRIANLTDTITHPNFQRKGLNSFLIGHLNEFCKSRKVSLIYRLSKPITTFLSTEKYAFIHSENLKAVSIKCSALPIFRLLTKLGGLPLYMRYFNFFTRLYFKKIKELKIESYQNLLTIPRDNKYFKHKSFVENFKIESNQDQFLFRYEYGLLIGDCNATNEVDVARIISKLKSYCFWIGLKEIKFRASKNHPLIDLFAQFGEMSDANPIMIKDLLEENIFDKLCITASDVNTF
jgi:GNAT superfamily N-acetyltransferase